MAHHRRVVITGIGPLSSIGIGKSAIWTNILEERIKTDFLENYVFGKYTEKFHIHRIDNFNIDKFGIDASILEDMKIWQYGEESIDLYYLIAAIKLALADSELKYEGRKDIGFVLTHENPGIEDFCSTFINKSYDIYKHMKNLSREEYFNIINNSVDNIVSDLQTFMFLFYASKIFDIHGYSLFINNSCASGSYAIEAASQIIKNGVNNAVLVASSEHPGIYKHLWMKKLGILSEDGKTRPFSKNRNGFVCGEGGAALVVEDMEHALKRGAYIYAEYIGGICNQESWKITVPDIHLDTYRKTISRSLKKCEVNPNDIDIITTHGLGAPLIDQYEAKAITDVFGENNDPPFITAFKPYFGHTLGNCALLETIVLLLSMQANTVLPVLNYAGEDPKLNIRVNHAKIHARINTGLKIVWGFGGYNASTIFRKIN